MWSVRRTGWPEIRVTKTIEIVESHVMRDPQHFFFFFYKFTIYHGVRVWCRNNALLSNYDTYLYTFKYLSGKSKSFTARFTYIKGGTLRTTNYYHVWSRIFGYCGPSSARFEGEDRRTTDFYSTFLQNCHFFNFFFFFQQTWEIVFSSFVFCRIRVLFLNFPPYIFSRTIFLSILSYWFFE